MFLDKKEVGQRILQIRKKYGYSMQKFGEIIDNAPKGSVNSWEKGVNLPNEKRLKQIATLGNMTLNELLYGSFNEYVDKLVGEKLGIQLPEERPKSRYNMEATASTRRPSTWNFSIQNNALATRKLETSVLP